MDPNAVAERELHAAARAIEMAAKKIAGLKPKTKQKSEAELRAEEEAALREEVDNTYEGIIVDACLGVAGATGSLLRIATQAQHELVSQGKEGKTTNLYHADSTWSDGLISAAKSVAASTSQLAENANLLCKHECEEVALIAAGKAVSASTAKLVAASRAKADPGSETQMRLGGAAKAVTRATDDLVEAARQAAVMDAGGEEQQGGKPMSAVKAKMLEMEAQMKVLRLEKELEESRRAMTDVHKSKYKK
eukprot:TRINITY_DN32361_c0_g1_i1.p1 TRINITY_DN32361_c0_g1~~TRINITY_DN32361_c0_g1_i1.p1  ORF type:complete len:249 (-),score=85.61 TRINITY_DN32361_c0_g1_i1:35-781(-)